MHNVNKQCDMYSLDLFQFALSFIVVQWSWVEFVLWKSSKSTLLRSPFQYVAHVHHLIYSSSVSLSWQFCFGNSESPLDSWSSPKVKLSTVCVHMFNSIICLRYLSIFVYKSISVFNSYRLWIIWIYHDLSNFVLCCFVNILHGFLCIYEKIPQDKVLKGKFAGWRDLCIYIFHRYCQIIFVKIHTNLNFNHVWRYLKRIILTHNLANFSVRLWFWWL